MQHKSLKLFISYCHSDSNYLNEFKKHLITLKRKGILNVWSDIELVSGDKLHEEIPKHLSEANLVAFLVSVDFLNSWYCFDMELKTILEKASNDNVRIIPIIVRSCMWQETTLGQYRSATRDGKPIANYSNQDDAWIEVVKSIEEAANKYAESDSPGDGLDANRYSQLDAKFIAKLQDTEVQFQNKYKDQIGYWQRAKW